MNVLRVGIAGCGVVGSEVVRLFKKQSAHFARTLGVRLVLAGIADRRVAAAKKIAPKGCTVTADAPTLAADPSIDILVELIGGTSVSYTIQKVALGRGAHVVTANKAVLAERGSRLFTIAREKKVKLLFEAAIGGVMPVVRTSCGLLSVDCVQEISGMLNGTANYILTEMTTKGTSFAAALKDAQKKGYAEADPTLDITGGDTAHKIALLARATFGADIPFSAISYTGIDAISAADITVASRMQRVIKLVARVRKTGKQLFLSVRPELLPFSHPFASVHGSTNAVSISSVAAGDIHLVGAGAGGAPTAVAVLSDIMAVARGAGTSVPPSVAVRVEPQHSQKSAWYIRCMLTNRPGAVAAIAAVLAKHGLSLSNTHQLHLADTRHPVPFAVTVYPACFSAVCAATAEIRRRRLSAEAPTVIALI